MSRAIFLILGLAASALVTGCAQVVGTPREGASAPAAGSTLYVSTTGKDNDAAYDGSTPQKAFLTVTKAVTVAASGATISIAAGRYVEAPLMLTKSLTLSGPQVASDTSTELPPLPPIDALCLTQACITTDSATTSSDRVINIAAAASGPPTVTLANLVILGPDMSKHPTKSSYGVVVDGVPVTVQGVNIVAGVGGPGSPGGNGGTVPLNAVGIGFPGFCTQSEPYSCDCSDGHKGGDQKDATGKVVAKGGAGGKVARANCYIGGEIDLTPPPNGNNGDPGDPGPPGANGSAGKSKDGHFARPGGVLSFQGSVAGTGDTGTSGASGGGGGPGGSQTYFIWGCDVLDAHYNDAIGGPGGAGGDGGAPGAGGTGGSQGGGAFGLVVANTTVATVAGTRLSIYGGKGGAGGSGGQGAAGQAGKPGGSGQPGRKIGCERWPASKTGGTGGLGGGGGNGGAGGGGGGGAGGPSVDVVLIGSSKLSGSQPATRGGSGGTGGGGGAAGPNGPLADGGAVGQQASTAQYDLK